MRKITNLLKNHEKSTLERGKEIFTFIYNGKISFINFLEVLLKSCLSPLVWCMSTFNLISLPFDK